MASTSMAEVVLVDRQDYIKLVQTLAVRQEGEECARGRVIHNASGVPGAGCVVDV